MEAEIDWLRSGAARWSLASDQQLLQTLEHMHQKMMSKCSEITHQLETMVTSLDEASITLQNTNNRFMALSNSQFIESRVYEDNTDVVEEKPKESQVGGAPTARQPHPAAVSSGLEVLQRLHEQVTILPSSDSDSQESSDGEELTRVILKPKDLYSSRPLPYIIGSHAWKTKWHAGLIAEDSDSESSESGQSRARELYSDSEPEDTPRPAVDPRDEISGGSSSGRSVSPCDADDLATLRTPAEVANELARRLRGPLVTTPAPDAADISPSEHTVPVRKMYRPANMQPTTAIIFPSEPPPLSSSDQSEPEDIFAELHRQAGGSGPYSNADKVHNAADDLFGFVEEPPPLMHAAKRNETFLPEQSDPQHTNKLAQESVRSESVTKKPVGGISLFGTNRNNETIGAAILKRKQRKSSSGSDDSCQAPVRSVKPEITDELAVDKENKNKEKDLIQDIFSKEIKKKVSNIVSNKENNNSKNIHEKQNTDIFEDLFAKSKNTLHKNTLKENKSAEKKTDLFSENIFDDIDDIFTSNISKVTLKEAPKEVKSLFEDDDNLFSVVGVIKENTQDKSQNNSKKKPTSIFDSDDELFSEKLSDSKRKLEAEDDKCSKITENKFSSSTTAKLEIKSRTLEKKSIFDSDDELISEKVTRNKDQPESQDKNKTSSHKTNNMIKDTKSIFDDSDDDSIFTSIKTSKNLTAPKEIKEDKTSFTDKLGSLNTDKVLNREKVNISDDVDDVGNLFDNNKDLKTKETPKVLDDKLKPLKGKTHPFSSPNLFDSDEDLFSHSNSKQLEVEKNANPNNRATSNLKQFKDESNFQTQKEIVKMGKESSDEPENVIKNVHSDAICKDEDDWCTGDEKTAEVNSTTPTRDTIVNKPDETRDVRETNATQGIESDLLKTRTDVTEVLTSREHSVEIASFSDTQEKNNYVSPESGNKDENECDKNILDIHTDIFDDLPPVFEKPTEPKKSKNINALFDDDSDDEALFFKKNDILVDDSEKPDNFSPGANVRLSGLFHDEPPAIDVDFVHKPIKTVLHDANSKDFDSKPDNIYPADQNLDVDTLKATVKAVGISKSSTESHKLYETEDNSDIVKQKTDEVDSKKVGKLKPNINLNINVNTLLPGASPKKLPKPVEQPEQPNAESVNENNKELSKQTVDNTDNKLTKSVSFDGEPESSTLDSKISKERAKIQVKRRPSTRRARREAVKKSGIDFGEDTTDSSNIGEDKTTQNINPNIEIHATDVDKGRKEPECSSTSFYDDRTKEQFLEKKTYIFKDKPENKEEESPSKDMKSKVVYILNDEDIFTDTKIGSKGAASPLQETKVESSNTKEDVKKTNILNIADSDDDDIFKSMISPLKSEENKTQINTLGKVYSETKTEISKVAVTDRDDSIIKDGATSGTSQQINEPICQKMEKPKLSLFDDSSDSDNELFSKAKPKTVTKNKTITETKTRTKSTLEFDSDEDLFGSKDKTVKDRSKKKADESNSKKNETKKIEVKASLFGDDDDDLFGDTKQNSEPKSFPSKATSSSTRDLTPKPVFDDPLSLLGDDD